MFCEPATLDELIIVVSNLKNNKAAGPDNIGPRLLTEISPAILQSFVHIINLSFTTGVVPDVLKVARVVPVYKKVIPVQYKIIVPFPCYPRFTKFWKKK